MKRLLLVCAAVVAMSSVGAAQDTPHYELFVGGSYVRLHGSGSELTQLLDLQTNQYQPHNMNLNLLGWETSLVENVNSWLGGEIDASGLYGTPNSSFLYPASQLLSPTPNFNKVVPVTTGLQTYLFGPRLSWRQHGKIVVFTHLLVGVARVDTSLTESAVVASNFDTLPVGSIKSGMGLAVSPGVGIDLRLNQRLMLRPIQVDYLMTHVYGQRQDNARISAGINIVFGEK